MTWLLPPQWSLSLDPRMVTWDFQVGYKKTCMPSYAPMLARSENRGILLRPVDLISKSVSLELNEFALNSEQLQMM